MEEPKVALLITSCDAYKDCWAPMIRSLDRYWPDCPYPRYIVSNYVSEDLPDTRFILVGDDKRCWCNLTRMALSQLDVDFIIFFQEDYWLGKKVNNAAIMRHVTYCVEQGLDYLKIQDDMRRDEARIGDSDYCVNAPDIRYSINTATAIWRVSTMIKLMIEDWSGWEYERQIIPYIRKNHIEIKSQILHSSAFAEKGIRPIKDGAIVRGVWTQAAVRFLKENGFSLLIPGRKIMGPVTTWFYGHGPGPRSLFRYPFWGMLKIMKSLKVNW